MRLSQGSLLTTLAQGVVELRSARRRTKMGWSPYRRMLCSNDMSLLQSAPGQIALHFKPPHGPPPYPWIQKNLVCAWDIFQQDWRMIPCESVDIITVFPTQTEEDKLKWWAYFNVFLENMSGQDKIAIMNS